jgi:hypothetical protein
MARPCCAGLAAVGAMMRFITPEAEPIFEVGRGRWDEAVLERGWLMSSSPARLPASSRAKLGVDARFEHQAAIFTAFWPLAGRKHGLADSTTRLPVTKEARISRPLTCESPCARGSRDPDRPLAIWYGGFLEACRHPEKVVRRLLSPA